MSDREEYQQQLEDQLAGWQADLLHLKDMTAEEHGNIHPEMKQRIRELERRIAAAKAQLPKLAAASDEEWETMKAKVKSTVFMAGVPKSNP